EHNKGGGAWLELTWPGTSITGPFVLCSGLRLTRPPYSAKGRKCLATTTTCRPTTTSAHGCSCSCPRTPTYKPYQHCCADCQRSLKAGKSTTTGYKPPLWKNGS